MIRSKKDLRFYLHSDLQRYEKMSHLFSRWKNRCVTNPINTQYVIWQYIFHLRNAEYHYNRSCLSSNRKNLAVYFHTIWLFFYYYRLRKDSYKTGIQIPPNTCGPGLQIWHYGSIIVNENTRIGKNVTLYPGVVIGHKVAGGPCPVIGDNCFIGAGAKIFGGVTIGNNVTIAPNSVVVSDLPANVVAGGLPAKVIKRKES